MSYSRNDLLKLSDVSVKNLWNRFCEETRLEEIFWIDEFFEDIEINCDPQDVMKKKFYGKANPTDLFIKIDGKGNYKTFSYILNEFDETKDNIETDYLTKWMGENDIEPNKQS